MSDFLSTFASYFTETEKESEIYQIWATIGSNAETELVAEVRSAVNEATDYSAMPVDRLRSILSFFYVIIRNYNAANGQATLTIDSATGDVSIPSGTLLYAEGGIVFEQQEDLYLKQGESASFQVIQGEFEESEGIYSEFIKIPVEGVDISSIEVTLNNVDVSVVSGDIITTPLDGFYPAYYDGDLYIKIFPGDTVAEPLNQTYTVRYRVCDGYQGRIELNKMQTYQDSIYDTNLNEVSYTLANDSIQNGLNEPPEYEIVNLLRYWLFVKDSVASVAEYKIWFLAQAEVGDVKIQGDYERWLITGDVETTGRTDAYLIDKDGLSLSTETITILEARLALVRDVGLTDYKDIESILHYYLIRVKSAEDLGIFNQAAKSSLQNFYNLEYEKNRGSSLFTDVDINYVKSSFRWDLSPVGVELVPYHYKETEILSTGAEQTVTLLYYTGEDPRGYYHFNYVVAEESFQLVFRELIQSNGEIKIYDELNVQIGQRFTNVNSVEITYNFPEDGTLESYWPVTDKDYVPVGSEEAFRVLQDVEFEVY